MRDRSRAVGHISGALALATLAALPAPAAPETVRKGSAIDVTVTDLRSSRGVVRACLTPNPRDFPSCREADTALRVIVPAGETVRLSFAGVKPGRYAIALLHDENNNNKADTAILMMPTEGYGFSRDARVRLGPPKFDAAAFEIGADAPQRTVHQKIRMRYML